VVVLEREHGRIEVWGEPRLRAAELQAKRAIASAELGRLPDGRPRLRWPDLVLFPPDTALPVAAEVELSVKDDRPEAICRASARCRVVSEVRYYAPPHIARAVSRAVSVAPARDAVRILSLDEALKKLLMWAALLDRLTRRGDTSAQPNAALAYQPPGWDIVCCRGGFSRSRCSCSRRAIARSIVRCARARRRSRHFAIRPHRVSARSGISISSLARGRSTLRRSPRRGNAIGAGCGRSP
jgi:hypothetical protein